MYLSHHEVLQLVFKEPQMNSYFVQPLLSLQWVKIILVPFSFSDERLSVLLSNLLVILMDTVDQGDVSVMNAMNLFAWVTKALVMRGHRQTDVWVDKLIGMLSHETVGTCVAEGFKLIMTQNEEYMNSDNYCNIRSVLFISLLLLE
jgi:hypothetical protein